MIEVTSQVDIARPAGEVFAFLADASNNPQWQKGMRSCQWLGDGPIEVGSQYRQEAAFLGRPVRSLFEVVAYEPEGPNRTITIRTIESTFPIEVTRSVTDLGGGRCRAQARIRGGPEGVVGRLLAPLTLRMVQRSVSGDYNRLRTQLEGPS